MFWIWVKFGGEEEVEEREIAFMRTECGDVIIKISNFIFSSFLFFYQTPKVGRDPREMQPGLKDEVTCGQLQNDIWMRRQFDNN